MPIKRIQFPDGSIKRVEVPEGATDEQTLAFVQSQYKTKPKAPAAPQEIIDPTEGNSFGQNALIGFGKAFADTGAGLKQAGTDAARYFVEENPMLFGGGQTMSGLITGKDTTLAGRLRSSLAEQQAAIDETRKRDAPLMNTGGGMVGNVVGQAAQIAVPIPGGAALKATSWAGKAAPYVGAAARAGTFGASQGVGAGESRISNAAESAAWGVGGQGLASGAGALARKMQPAVTKSKQAALNTLKRLNIPTHLSQTMDSGFLKLLSSVVNKLPFSGVKGAGQRQDAAFNREMAKTMGAGNNVTEITDDVMQTVKQQQSRGYDTLFGRNKVTLDTQTVSELRAVAKQATDDLTPDKAKIVQNQINKFIDKADDTGSIPGRAYQNIRDGMRELEKHPEHGYLVREVRHKMEAAANRSFQGNDAAALKTLNGQYSNRKIIEKALAENAGAGGNVTPGSLWKFVKGKYGSTKEMRDLARAGQLVLKDGIPDSYTSQREMVTRLLGLGSGAGAAGYLGMLPLAAKATGLGLLVGRGLNSQAAAKLLPGSGAKTVKGLARLMKSAPYAAPALANAQGITVGGGRVATPEDMERDAEIVRQFRARQGR